jgi:uncharacterized protein YggE
MFRFALPIAAAIAVAFPVSAAEVQIVAQGPVVELTMTESVAARPDIAEIGAGVTTQAQTAVAAMDANAGAMNAVIERIKALGIAERDIQTSGISLFPQYDYDQQARQQVFRGYQVTNRVQVTLRGIERTGEALDALVAAGATDLSGPTWSVADPKAARAQAREQALAASREQALGYARAAGYANIRLLQISEATPPGGPVPMIKLAARDAAEQSTPVQPGEVQEGITITVTYELTQ